MKARWAALSVLVLLAGCDDESMDTQNRLRTYAKGDARPLVPGTVAQGALERERATLEPPPVGLAFVERGQQRYGIYCAPCHGLAGDGDGIVVARGFPKPRPFGDPRLLQASAADLVDVISHGKGVMYSFSDRVEPRDRWAIVAYIRALQLAGQKGTAPSGREAR
ncbi:MAG: cytochrome c [Alphaproteobacteria bacterium]|nr:cytochrome c [Alphaproteobacteria bacterium]